MRGSCVQFVLLLFIIGVCLAASVQQACKLDADEKLQEEKDILSSIKQYVKNASSPKKADVLAALRRIEAPLRACEQTDDEPSFYDSPETLIERIDGDSGDNEPSFIASTAATVSNLLLEELQNTTTSVLFDIVNQACKNSSVLEIFGIQIQGCSFSPQSSTLKGRALISNKYMASVDLLITKETLPSTANMFILTLNMTNSFALSDVAAVKNTIFDTLRFGDVYIKIVSSSKNSQGLKAGIQLFAKVIMNKPSTTTILSSVLGNTAFQAVMTLSGGTNLKALLQPSATQNFYLTFIAQNFAIGDKFGCTSASVTLANTTPTIRIASLCTLVLQETSKLTLNTTMIAVLGATDSLSLSTAAVGPVPNAFNIDGLTISKASLSGTLSPTVKEIAFSATAIIKNVNINIAGNVRTGVYSFALVDTTLSDTVKLFGFNELGNKLPVIALQKIEVKIATKATSATPFLTIVADTKFNIKNYTVDTVATIEFSKEKISFIAPVQKPLTFGPLTLTAPAVSFKALRTEPVFELEFSGNITVWKLDKLRTVVGFAKYEDSFGWKLIAQLGQTFKLVDAIPAVSQIQVINQLGFKNPQLQISSYPIVGIDSIKREGVVFQGSLVFGSNQILNGLGQLYKGKVNEIPFIIPFGSGLSPDVQNLKVVAVLPFAIPVSSRFLKFDEGTVLAVGMSPPSFGLSTGLTITIPNDEQELKFRVALNLDSVGASAVTETMNEWVNPFGFKGIVVKKLAIDVGINYAQFSATGTPSRLGLAGFFNFPYVGEVKVATLADLVKQQYVLLFAIEQFGKQSIMAILADLGVNIKQDLLPDIEFRNCEIYIAPTGGNIGSIVFQPGFNVQGKMYLMNKLFAEVKYTMSKNGLIIYTNVAAFSLGPLDVSGILVDMALTTTDQHLILKGKADLNIVFELTYEVDIRMSKQELYFMVETPTFFFEASAEPSQPDSLEVTGAFKFTILNQLSGKINATIEKIKDRLDDLQEEVKRAQEEKGRIESAIDNLNLPSGCGTAAVATLAATKSQISRNSEFGYAGWIEDKSDYEAETEVSEEEVLQNEIAPNTLGIFDKLGAALRKLCEEFFEKLNGFKNKLADAVGKLGDATARLKGETAKYASNVLDRDFFRLERITFHAAMNDIKSSGALKITIDAKVGNKSKQFSYVLKRISKIIDIVDDLTDKIVKRDQNN